MRTLEQGWEPAAAPVEAVEPIRLVSEGRRRLTLFLLVFALVAGVGWAWVWSRAPVYESHSLLQVSFDTESNRHREVHRNEEISFHRQLLTSRHLMNALSERMSALGIIYNATELESMLQVSALPDSRILRLGAAATTAAAPPALLREWELLYRQRFLRQQDEELRTEARILEEKIALLERQQEQQRSELHAYQQAHSIVSIERDENRVLNRIKALARSLDGVSEERQRLAAELGSLQAALRRGEVVVRPQDQRGIDNLEQRATDLEDQLKAMGERYTHRYLGINSRAMALQNRLDQIRESVVQRQRDSRNLLLEETQRKLDAALVREQVAQDELSQQELLVRDFDRQMAELGERQRRLEQLAAELGSLRNERDRLLGAAEPAVRVSVLEPPYVPQGASRPHYWQDSALVAGLALAVATLGLLLYRIIVPAKGPEIVLQTLANGVPERLIGSSVADGTKVLTTGTLLSVATCKALLAAPDKRARLTVMLLLSGVHLREIPSLCWYHLDSDKALLSVPSAPPRDLELSDRLGRFLAVSWEAPENKVTPLLIDLDGHPLSPVQLEELLAQAAVEAGLADVSVVNGRALELTYLAFLAEQGLGHQQLELLLGILPADVLDPLEGRLPDGPERLLQEINRIYPALA